MTQATKYNITQWMKILSMLTLTLTVATQGGKIIKILADMYVAGEVRAASHDKLDSAQTRLLEWYGQRINTHDSVLFSHEHRIGQSEFDINMLQLHDPKSKYNIK